MTKTATWGTEKVLQSLISVFRNHGFEGASLSRFTESSGPHQSEPLPSFSRGKGADGDRGANRS